MNKKCDISSIEQKKVLLGMLKYFDKTCRDNGIKYSLIGGSLIGAIRHHGFIPWDDDVDVILMPEEYQKLMEVLKGNKRYLLFTADKPKTYRYPFPKLIDSTTTLEEIGYGKIEGYGMFLDILSYHYVSNNKLRQRLQYLRQMAVKKMFVIMALSPESEKNVFKKMLVYPTKIVPCSIVKRLYLRICTKQKPTNYVFSNWPRYGREKETQCIDDVMEYVDVDFEGMRVMVFKNYDNVLRRTFGDYMKLPPKSERISLHNSIIKWK